MFKWLKDWREYIARKKRKNSNEPYIEIISEGMDSVGRIKIEFDWNTAFITDLRNAGFTAESEEEIVQKWFQAITLSNLDKLLEDDELSMRARINPSDHPNLN